MKLLVASVPAAGHFNPLTGPALRLAERGHDVRWYAGPDYGARAEKLGLAVVPYREAVEVTADNLNALYPERRDLKGPKAIEFESDVFFSVPVRSHYRDVMAAREEFPFDAMLVDGAFYAAYLVAKHDRIPVFALGSIAAPSVRDPNAVTPFFGLRPARTPVGRIVNRVARSMILSGSRKGVDTFNRTLAEVGLPPVSVEEFMDCTLQPDVARRVFAIGIPELEFPGVELPPNTEWVGPLLPRRTPSATPVDPRIFGASGRVILVSQGTVDNHEPEKLMIPALEVLAGGDRIVVVATGGVGTEELRRRFPQQNVVIEDWVDFAAVLPHTAAYVTNGGMGGCLLALSAGVPLLTAGTREGKGDINARLAYRGLAIDLRTEHPSAGAIRRGLRRLLEDGGIRERVAHVRDRLAEYDSVGTIERGIQEELERASTAPPA